MSRFPNSQVHRWDLTPEQAIELQLQLRDQVRLVDDFAQPLQTVAGVDAAFEDDGATTRAAIVTLGFPTLQPIEKTLVRRPTTFPYIPGLLSFREIPAVLAALEQLQQLPAVLLCDGMGVMHPRRFGIAAHLGVLTNLPTIGVGKSYLCGTHEPVPDQQGAWVPVYDAGEQIGAVVRTRVGTKPLYISPGHRVSHATAVDLVLRCTTKYRLPETTRHADQLSKDKANNGGLQLP
ncbi:MAG: deoxyribonuclease V [Chloroflexi bacterium]|nr:deoxyribonuclease V [Chloroflexota bacterium]